MADEPTTQPVVAPLANDPAARTPTGELKDQAALVTTTEVKSTDTPAQTPASTEPAKADDKTLLSKDDKTKVEPAKVPEKYEFKAPDGFEIDAKFIAEATPLLKELGLSNDQAQKLVDMQIARERIITESAYKLYEETRNGWRKDVFNSPDLGTGSDLKPEVKTAINDTFKLLDPKTEASFRQAMDMTGSGDNPAFVRAMYELSKLVVREGAGVRGGGPSKLGQTQPGAAPKSAASALYPNLPSSSNG